MGMIYLVRKKLFRSKEGMKQLYYAVQRTLQPRGGVTTEKLAQRMARRKGMGEGDVQSVLVDLPKYIEEALSEGECVTIRGLGSFNLAITSEGFFELQEFTLFPSQTIPPCPYHLVIFSLTFSGTSIKPNR